MEKRAAFEGPVCFDYLPEGRVVAELSSSDSQNYDVSSSDGPGHRFTRFALASFEIGGRHAQLELYWTEGYAGGVFLPFTDAGAGRSTYGGGRYLLDTSKGADLGTEEGGLVLDFNFAYQPSCSYDPRWVCPLAPAANRLPFAVEAGERLGEP